MMKLLVIVAILTRLSTSYAQNAPDCDGNCYSSGDPHYQTFDCLKFEYHGKCSYTLLTSCDTSLPIFKVIANNKRMEYHPKIAYTESVTIKILTDELTGVYDNVRLTDDHKVYLNDEEQSGNGISFNNNDGQITIGERQIVVHSGLGFTLTWGNPFRTEISITDEKLRGRICGLCGNGNGNVNDDMVTPTNEAATDSTAYADSWNTDESCGPCVDCEAPTPEEPAPPPAAETPPATEAPAPEAIFKLVGGFDKNEGKILYNNGKKWVYFYQEPFSLNEGNVICRELGLPNATDAGLSTFYGIMQSGASKIDFKLSCSGDEATTAECERSDVDTAIYNYAYRTSFVKCRSGIGEHTGTEGQTVLVGGFEPYNGRFYMYSNGSWIGFCINNVMHQYIWNLANFRVFCKMAGFPGFWEPLTHIDDINAYGGDPNGRRIQGYYYYGWNYDSFQLDKTKYTCNGDERSITECSKEADQFDQYDCLHGLAITCQPIDYCEGVTCQNGGHCFVENESFRCVCSNEYTGTFCHLENPCEAADWTFYDDKCYLFNKTISNYTEAVTACDGLGATLAMPKEINHDIFLKEKMPKLTLDYNLWIGLKKGNAWPGLWQDGSAVSDDEGTEIGNVIRWETEDYPFLGEAWYNHDCGATSLHGWKNSLCISLYAHICEKQATKTPAAVPPPSGMQEGDFALLHGADPSEGILHVVHENELGTVCDDAFDNLDAGIACRHLGYADGEVVHLSQFGFAGNGRIWLDKICCEGDEKSIADCTHNPWGLSACNHNEDVALKCFKEGSRVVDGTTASEGRLEYLFNNEWGTVCKDDSWGNEDAEVACKQLGNQGVLSADKSFGAGTGTIGFSDVACVGDESSLAQCTRATWGQNSCEHSTDVGIQCKASTIRLVSTYADNVGFVQIYHGNQWGVICSMSITASKLFCKLLGYSDSNDLAYDMAYAGGYIYDNFRLDMKIWLTFIRCTGDEDTFEDCSYSGWATETSKCVDLPMEIECV